MPFSGRASYTDFRAEAEDVADYITMISPSETPLLDYLGDSPYAAENVLHKP